MKKFLLVIFCIALLLAGCSNEIVRETTVPSALINNQKVELKPIEIDTDSLIDNDVNDNVDFDAEKRIFGNLIDSKATAEFNDQITFELDKDYQKVMIYDHLLSEKGCSYFDKSINQYSLSIDDHNAIMKLSEHPAIALSSDSSFLKTEEIRGFRVVLQDSEGMHEYAFVINVKK